MILWSQQVLESLRLSDPSEEDEWDELAFGSELLCALGFRLRSLLDRLAVSPERVDGETHRESLLVGLALTGYIETNDLQPDHREKAMHLSKSEDIRLDYLPVPAVTGQLWQRLPA